MTKKELIIKVNANNEMEAKHIKNALQTIADNFKPNELVSISKKIELPLVKMKIKSML